VRRAPLRGAIGPLECESCLYEGHINFERNMGERKKYVGSHFAWLKYESCFYSVKSNLTEVCTFKLEKYVIH
jgi:hypothetical protein